MLPYWLNVASNPQAPADERTLAKQSTDCARSSSPTEKSPSLWPNAELLVVRDDEQPADAVHKQKAKPGKTSASPAASAPLRPSSASASSTNTCSPCTRSRLGCGKRVFAGTTGLELTGAKTYRRSGLISAIYRSTR